ncbi:MAG: metal ABC transporter substrate-binding protein [Planctomycetota bacterium]
MKSQLCLLLAWFFTLPAFAEPLRIVTTTSDLKSVAEEIGGDKVGAISLASGDEDPHFIQAKPSYMMKAKRADLWIRIGLELEIGYEGLILDGSRNHKIRVGQPGHLDTSEGVIRLEVPTTQKVDRSMGDIHPLGNPHYWLDPWNGKIIAQNICRRLCQLDPANADAYQKNYAAFCGKVDRAMFGDALIEKLGPDALWNAELDNTLDAFVKQKDLEPALGGWVGKLRPYRGRKIITYHRSWSYFANRFGLIVADELEPKPGIPPSPGHVVDVINKVKAEEVKVLLMEPFYSRNAPELVANHTGIKIVEVANSVGGQPEAADYLSLISNIVERLADAFKE